MSCSSRARSLSVSELLAASLRAFTLASFTAFSRFFSLLVSRSNTCTHAGQFASAMCLPRMQISSLSQEFSCNNCAHSVGADQQHAMHWVDLDSHTRCVHGLHAILSCHVQHCRYNCHSNFDLLRTVHMHCMDPRTGEYCELMQRNTAYMQCHWEQQICVFALSKAAAAQTCHSPTCV